MVSIASGADGRTSTYVRVLDADPDLASELDPVIADQARDRLIVEAMQLDPGTYDAHSLLPKGDGQLGLLVLDGLFIRDVRLAGTSAAELIGPGDLVRPWYDVSDGAPVSTSVQWRVLETCSLAVLDRRFVRLASAWPELMAAVVGRAVTRAQSLAVNLAISCITGVELRVLVLLWHLAARFGHVGPDGVRLPLPLTHQILARLLGASRPTVSTAMSNLARGGLVSRRQDSGYLLHGEPPEILQPHPRRSRDDTLSDR